MRHRTVQHRSDGEATHVCPGDGTLTILRSRSASAGKMPTVLTIFGLRVVIYFNDLLVTLKSGVSIVVLAAAIQGLEEANSEQLSHVEISPSGLGLHFPAIDVDVYLPGILEGSFGTKRWLEVRDTQS
jgi:hypothetical protein